MLDRDVHRLAGRERRKDLIKQGRGGTDEFAGISFHEMIL